MSRQLPAHPSLEFLKKEAKALLAEQQGRDPSARLADVQHALAREYGFPSWPRLKAHVESLTAARADARQHPLAGVWIANVAKSRRNPVNLFQRATIECVVDGDVVTITDHFVDEHGVEARGQNTLHVDGSERSVPHGYSLLAEWRSNRQLAAIVKQSGAVVNEVIYDVSETGDMLTIADRLARHLIVLDRA